MIEPDDVPSSIDLRTPEDAHVWAQEADHKRPWRAAVRATIAETIGSLGVRPRSVLELGSGPGLLAEQILRSVAVDAYTLFDFSPPMLELSRARVGHDPRATFVLGDFIQPAWPASLEPPFDAVVTMQAVHELRHKRRAPGLYRQVHDLLRPSGVVVVCDHTPPDVSPRMTALHATEAEQHAALAGAGFVDVTTHALVHGLYICGGRRPPAG